MRLIQGKIRRLEAAAAAAALEAPAEIQGLVWSSAETVVDGESLREGESIAVDCYIDEWPEETMPIEWRTVERITGDREDLGQVYGPDGEVCGRVTERRRGGRLVSFELFGGPLAATDGAADARKRGGGGSGEGA